MDMLALIGYDLLPRDATLDISPERRMDIMIEGRKALREQTGQDFGFDLSAWREFLIAHESYGYTHSYAFSGVDDAVHSAILDETRIEIVSRLETRGKELLKSLLTSSCIPFDENLGNLVPDAGGVYHIFEAASKQQTSVYFGQSPNMRSHITSKRVKTILQRRLKGKEFGAVTYHVQFIPLDEIEQGWFVKFAIEELKPLAYG